MKAHIAICMLIAVALAGCSSNDADSDGDGIPDENEQLGWVIQIETMTYQERLDVTSDPKLADTDGDGIWDQDEFSLGTNPRLKDTDGDGLTDCEEAVHTNVTQCEDPSYKGDSDGGYGTSPSKADSDAGPSRYKLAQPFDFRAAEPSKYEGRWGDGIDDGTEIRGYEAQLGPGRTRMVTSDPRNVDSDGDGLEDGEEFHLYGGDPTVADTDGDGCADGSDPWPDRAETYAPGLMSYTVHQATDGDGADLQLFLVISTMQYLAGEGGVQVHPGFNDISEHEPPAQSLFHCQLRPFDPWTQVQVTALDVNDDEHQPLDIWSITAAEHDLLGNAAKIWWNVRDGTYSWEKGGSQVENLVFEGIHGSLELAPKVA